MKRRNLLLSVLGVLGGVLLARETGASSGPRFVDLYTAQTVAGAKTFSDNLVTSGDLTASGGDLSLGAVLGTIYTTFGPASGPGVIIASAANGSGKIGVSVGSNTSGGGTIPFSVCMDCDGSPTNVFQVVSTGNVTLDTSAPILSTTASAAGINLVAASAANASGDFGFSCGVTTDVPGANTTMCNAAYDLDGTPVEVWSVDVEGDVQMDGDLAISGGNITTALTCDSTVTVTGKLTANSMFVQKQVTIAADDATPTVAGGNIFTTSANSGATVITDLDDPVAGQVVTICGGSDTNSSTIADAANFALSAGFTASLDDCITLLVQADNDYVELGRVNN